MKIFVTYSNDLYAETRDFSARMALKKGGFDKAVVYAPSDIDPDFAKKNERILGTTKGAGLWLWKPYVFYKAIMDIAKDGDFVFYADAGSFFFRSCEKIFASMKDDDVWVSDIALIEREYTKPQAFDILNCNSEDFKNSNQIQGNFICVRKSERSVAFVKEWLDNCCNYELINGEDAEKEKDLTFIDHRYDQSILSLMCKSNGVKPHCDPSQLGRVPEKYKPYAHTFKIPSNYGEYPPCIILHRMKSVDRIHIAKFLLYIYLPKMIIRKLVK